MSRRRSVQLPILLFDCTVLRAVVLTQYRRVTDVRTDGIDVASTALAKRRAVKNEEMMDNGQILAYVNV